MPATPRTLTALALLALAIGAGSWPRPMSSPLLAQQPSEKDLRLQLLSVGGIVYQLMGAGGSSLVLIREDSVALIDSKPRGWGKAVLAAVARLTDLPVTTVISTHAHLDQVGGGLEIPGLTDIVAHENAAATMKKMEAFDGPGAKWLPTRTVGKQLSLFEGSDRVDLYYFGRGHTDGDLVVVFPEHKIAYLGDLFPLKGAPVIDTAHGGSAVALSETLDRIVRDVKGVERVVAGRDPGPAPGTPRSSFGDIHSWNDLVEYAAFNRDLLAAVRVAIREGKSVADAIASVSLTATKYPGYDMQQVRANVESMYRELQGQRVQ